MSIPLPLADKPGQGELWAKVRTLSNAYLDATTRGDTHEAKRLEQRLSQLRHTFHRLHRKSLPQEQL